MRIRYRGDWRSQLSGDNFGVRQWLRIPFVVRLRYSALHVDFMPLACHDLPS